MERQNQGLLEEKLQTNKQSELIEEGIPIAKTSLVLKREDIKNEKSFTKEFKNDWKFLADKELEKSKKKKV